MDEQGPRYRPQMPHVSKVCWESSLFYHFLRCLLSWNQRSALLLVPQLGTCCFYMHATSNFAWTYNGHAVIRERGQNWAEYASSQQKRQQLQPPAWKSSLLPSSRSADANGWAARREMFLHWLASRPKQGCCAMGAEFQCLRNAGFMGCEWKTPSLICSAR